MKLFLSSAGIKPETKEAFLKLLEKDPKQCTVAFIPTACDPKPNKDYVQWTVDQLNDLGFRLFTVDLKGENEKSLYEKLESADVVCVNGGDTFYLLDEINKSGFDKVIRRLLDKGKVYMGVSAGTYIACPNIEMSHWKHENRNTFGLKSLKALGLIDFLISVHYKDEFKDTVKKGAKETELPVAAITDQQAIVVDNDNISLAGSSEFVGLNDFKFSS